MHSMREESEAGTIWLRPELSIINLFMEEIQPYAGLTFKAKRTRGLRHPGTHCPHVHPYLRSCQSTLVTLIPPLRDFGQAIKVTLNSANRSDISWVNPLTLCVVLLSSGFVHRTSHRVSSWTLRYWRRALALLVLFWILSIRLDADCSKMQNSVSICVCRCPG